MRKRFISLLLFCILLVAGCGAEEPLEEARTLQRNGFQTSYHQYMWTLLGTNETENITEATFSHTEHDAFFAVIRIDAETAQTQGLTTPESMELLLMTYVANYAGEHEKIISNDSDIELVRELSFDYEDAEANATHTYLAKLVLNKQSGEVMIVLASHPKRSDNLLKDEVSLIMENAALQEMTSA